MYKGYKNIIKEKSQENKLLSNKLTKCPKCNKYNTVVYSPNINNNVIQCYFCGNPCYIIKDR
jgi:hypothetical protein